MIEKVIAICGWFVFIFALVFQAFSYGSRWEFGRYFMPRTLVAPGGLHHLDGSLIDPINRSLISSGRQEEIHLCLTCLLVIAAAFTVHHFRKACRMRAEFNESRRNLRESIVELKRQEALYIQALRRQLSM